MTDDVQIVVGIRGDASGGRVIKKSLDDISSSGDKAISTTRNLEFQAKATAIAGNALARAFAATAAVFGAGQIIQMADNYRMLHERIKLATRSTDEFTAAFNGLKQVSNQTGSSLNDAVDVFQRLSFVRDEIGATVDQMVTFTGTVQKMGVMSGASTQSMSAGLLQLGQALSAGVVRAEEFNSVVENTPVIAKAIADQFGVTTGELRNLVLNGLVDSADVFNAVLNEAAAVEEKYAEMPMTIGRALAELKNNFAEIIGILNESSGATEIFSVALKGVAVGAKGIALGIIGVFDTLVMTLKEVGNYINNLVNSLIINPMNKALDMLSKITGGDYGSIASIPTAMSGSYYNQTVERLTKAGQAMDVFSPFESSEKSSQANSTPRSLSKDYDALADKIRSTTKLTKEQKDAIKQQKDIQDNLNDAVKQSRSETEKLYDKIAEQERLRPFAKTAEQAEAINKNIKNAQDELEALRVKAELNSPVAKAFASLASEIDDGFKDAFKSAFTESDGGFKKLLEGWKNTFKNFLAELAYQATVRPILVSLVGAVGSSMGLSSGAVASTMGNVTGASGILGGGTGGGFSLSGLSGLSGLLNGGLYSQTLGSVGTGVGNLLGGYGYNFMGPTYAGSIGAGAFGNMGYGALGGLAASLFGLGNSNSMVNMATGTLGSLAGGAIGTSIGSILGMSGGPVGAVIGGFLGTALGGLFGGGKPTDGTQGGGVDLSTGEVIGINGMTGKKYNAQNASFRDSVLEEASNLVKLLQSVGGTTSGKVSIAVGSRDGLRLDANGQYTNFGFDSQGFINGIMKAVVDGTTGLSATFKAILDKVGVTDTQKLAAAFEFGKQFDAFVNQVEKSPVSVLEETLKALNEQLATLQKQAVELGLPTDQLTIAYNKQKDALLNSIKAQMAGFQTLDDMNRSFKSFFDGQALGANSTLSPTQKLQLAQDNFGALLTKAQGGDLSVTQDLLKAANELLDIGRNVYASSVSFAGLENFVRSSVGGVAQQAGYEGTDTVSALTTEIIRGNTQLNGSVSEMVDVLRDLYNEAVRTRKLQESIRNQTAAA